MITKLLPAFTMSTIDATSCSHQMNRRAPVSPSILQGKHQLHIRVAINRINEHHINIIVVEPDRFSIRITFVLFIPNKKNPAWYNIIMKTAVKYPSLYSTNSEKPLNLFLPLLRIELTSSTCHSTLRTSTQS
jgi:hypothetical protein